MVKAAISCNILLHLVLLQLPREHMEVGGISPTEHTSLQPLICLQIQVLSLLRSFEEKAELSTWSLDFHSLQKVHEEVSHTILFPQFFSPRDDLLSRLRA